MGESDEMNRNAAKIHVLSLVAACAICFSTAGPAARAESERPKLVEIGPMSQTYKFDADNPATWVELFSPDRDITVRGFSLTDVRVKTGDAVKPLQHAEDRLVRIADQEPNPNYPKTTPRGGTGKAIFVR